MNNVVRSVAGLAVVTAALLLSACSTLPLPARPDESLLLIPTDITDQTWENGHIRVVSARIVLRQTNVGGELFSVTVPTGRRIAALGLPPGRYVIAGLVMTLQWSDERNRGEWQDRFTPNGMFLVVSNTVQCANRGLVVDLEPGGGYRFRLEDTTTVAFATRRSEILEEIQSDRRWPAWEEYVPVNLD